MTPTAPTHRALSPARRARRVSAALALALAVAGAVPALAVADGPAPSFDPTGLALELVPFADGLESPVYVTGDGSGTGWLYALEQAGRIVALSPDGDVSTVPVLDIRDRITAGGEQGLLGVALHPDFRDNGRLFVNYTRAEDGATTISEFLVGDAGTADPAGERVLLVIDQPYPNHNGGMVTFDSDGMLLIGMGDGGSGGDPEGHGQNPESLLGKMLRIDVDSADGAEPYAIPTDNPFLDVAGTRPEILALGVRNPWRFSVDRATGDLWIGDVGQGDQEEVSVVPVGSGGLNLGWNRMEGDACYSEADCDASDLVLPVATISHGDGACSVIGGYVYRGNAIPALAGGYLYTDLCVGTLWVLDAAAGIAAGTATPVPVGEGTGTMVSFGEGDDGELFVVDQGGSVLRVMEVGGAARG